MCDGILDLPDVYKTRKPPAFGHAMLSCFTLDPEFTNLNNGSWGTLPQPVQEACARITALSERNPDLWIRITYVKLLVQVRQMMADFLKVKDVDEIVMVPNASHGLNTILWNFTWTSEDTVVLCNTTYLANLRTAEYLSDSLPHPQVSEFTILFPTSHAKILADWRVHIENLVKQKKGESKIVAVIDAIASKPGILLPWEGMVEVCKAHNVWTVIDAAHVIGQQLNVSLDDTQPDFFVTNPYKWLSSKRGCAVMYVPKRNQHIIRGTFPTAHAYMSPAKRTTTNFVDQFAWNGTQDFIPCMSVGPALAFRKWVGGEDAIDSYCRSLAIEGGKRAAAALGTRLLDPTGEFTCHMVNIGAPLSPKILPSATLANIFNQKMLEDQNIYVAFYHYSGSWWVRASAQIWNELEDFDVLVKAVKTICQEIEVEFLPSDNGQSGCNII